MARYLKPVLVLALLVAACLSGRAAPGDQPISRLPALTNAPTVDDLLVIVDDPLGTPVTKKITVGNFGLNLPALPTNAIISIFGNTSNLNSFTFQTNVTTRSFNLEAFGARGDGKIATNCAITLNTRALTAAGGTFVPGDVGKVISIYGAGTNGLNLTTTITNVASANAVTLADVASTTITGNSAVYGTDQTTNIQAAISFLATNSGGTLVVPGGIYIINGPLLDTGTNSLHHNSQIICPSVAKIGNLCPTIRIRGQQAAWARGLSTVRSNEFVSYGSCFWSTLPTGPNVNPGRVIDFRDFGNPAAVGFCNNGDTLPLGNVNVEVRDMIWRAAFDNNMTLLDLQGTDGSIVERCIIDTGWHQGNTAPVPTQTNGFGLKTAGSFNENLCRLDNTMVRNFYNGVDLGENGLCPYVLIEGCVNAFNFTSLSGGASRWIGMANVQECTNIFLMGPCAASVYADFVSVYNQERYTGGNMNLLVDPVSALTGRIAYKHSSAGLAEDVRLNVVGGLGVTLSHTMLGLGEVHETRMLVDTNIFGHRMFLYGNANPGINWTTNILTFADSPKYVAYLQGSASQWVLEHTQSGQNVIINDGQDNMTLGVAGKNFKVNPLSGSGTRTVEALSDGSLIAINSTNADVFWKTNAAIGGISNSIGPVTIRSNLNVINNSVASFSAIISTNSGDQFFNVILQKNDDSEVNMIMRTLPEGVAGSRARIAQLPESGADPCTFSIRMQGGINDFHALLIRTNGTMDLRTNVWIDKRLIVGGTVGSTFGGGLSGTPALTVVGGGTTNLASFYAPAGTTPLAEIDRSGYISSVGAIRAGADSGGPLGNVNIHGTGPAAGDIAATNCIAARWVLQADGRKTTTTNMTSTATSFADISGLTANVIAGRKYTFKLVLFVSDSVAADGAKIDFNGGSAAATDFRAHTKIFDSALLLSSQGTALATAYAAGTMTGSSMIEVNGSFEPSGSGTFIPRFAQNAHTSGTLTLFRGSHLWIEDMNL